MKHFRFSLTFAILASLSCLLVLTWLLLGLISFKTSEKDILAQKSDEGRLLLASFVHLLPGNFGEAQSPGAAHRFAARIADERSFRGILVVDRQGRERYRTGSGAANDPLLAETIRTGAESAMLSNGGFLLSRYAPVREGGAIVGAARLSLSLAPEYERLSRSRHLFLAYFLLDFLLLLVLGSYLLSRSIVLPVRRLLAATAKIADGELDCRIPVPGSAEIAELAEAFNRMVEALRRKKGEVDEHIRSLERINRDLQSAREETLRTEKMASVGLLAAGTAHEIGTPLAAIMGYAGILKDDLGADEEKSDYLSRIEEEASRIDRIIRGMLDYARPSVAAKENVNIAELLGNIMKMLDEQGVFKNIDTTLSVEDGLPCLCADRHELQQVFTNLFINARDAMPGGGTLSVRIYSEMKSPAQFLSSPESSVRGRRRDDFRGAFHASLSPDDIDKFLCVAVSDTGMGIAHENLEKVFDPFFTTKDPGKGTGLGLAVTARIVDSLGGRITVESILTKGSSFIVWLPLVDATSSLIDDEQSGARIDTK